MRYSNYRIGYPSLFYNLKLKQVIKAKPIKNLEDIADARIESTQRKKVVKNAN